MSVHPKDKSMVNARPFGRRNSPQHQAARPMEAVQAPVRAQKAGLSDVVVAAASPNLPETSLTLDDGFENSWETRKHGFTIPWRPLSLMASLCFGIASFALPDTVNDAVQWLLYALMAAALFAGFSKPRSDAKG